MGGTVAPQNAISQETRSCAEVAKNTTGFVAVNPDVLELRRPRAFGYKGWHHLQLSGASVRRILIVLRLK
ncbi:MAG: hypothetical protein DMG13_10790 [Acidobacteria bacterium]|nr:MAG: hypothetical protein DMG13_10790 [Acidobacteriota bacterium]